MTRPAVASVALLSLLLAGCATAPDAKKDPRDPLEGFNRASYKFNDALDRAVLKPVAKGYKAVAPQFVETGVTNFFSNLGQTTVIVNDLLQAKFKNSLNDTGRFLLNATVGIGGLFDPASAAGLDRNDEDFGQTLGKWGVSSGAYLMVPFFGPTTVRDGFGSGVDVFTGPVHYVERDAWRYGLDGMDLIDARARRLPLEDTLNQAYDKYTFIKNAFLQQREYAVKDGNVPSPTFDEPLEDPDPGADKK
ncbi:MAG: VacJ family lipoprotein [Gammaproteobacteria bacterium]